MVLAKWGEDNLARAVLVAMAVLPVGEIFLRAVFKTGLPGSTALVQNLTLWVGFVGAMIATREGTHLKLAVASALIPPWAERIAANAAAMISAAVAVGLAWASAQFMVAEMDSPVRIGGILPVWVILAVLPFSFAIIAL
ncbi:MAG: TRAP transporter small permease subunit, partial [Alphaproteobacteria bacterium]